MESNFGWSTPYSVGVEEEFQLVRAESYELVSRIEAILSAFEGEPVEPRIKPELHQSVVEVSTKISASVAEAVDDLGDLRARLRRAAADEGTLIASAGTHPFSRYENQEVTDRPRYAELSESLGWLADRQLIFGLHVHVGVGSADKAIACADGLRSRRCPSCSRSPRTPRSGRAATTGLASTRVKISEALPRSGLPPALVLVRRVRAPRRAGRPHRLLPRLHPHLVGRAPAPAARDGRGPDLRRPDAYRERGRARRPDPVARRDARKRLRVRRDRSGRARLPPRGEQVARARGTGSRPA